MSNKQNPPAGMQYDESTHQWVPIAPVAAPPIKEK